MGLNHPFTCPTIDKLINNARDTIYEHIYSIILEHNPWIENLGERHIPEVFLTRIKEEAECLSDQITDLLEEARSCNEDMRSSADTQIAELEEQISDLESELQEYKDN